MHWRAYILQVYNIYSAIWAPYHVCSVFRAFDPQCDGPSRWFWKRKRNCIMHSYNSTMDSSPDVGHGVAALTRTTRLQRLKSSTGKLHRRAIVTRLHLYIIFILHDCMWLVVIFIGEPTPTQTTWGLTAKWKLFSYRKRCLTTNYYNNILCHDVTIDYIFSLSPL